MVWETANGVNPDQTVSLAILRCLTHKVTNIPLENVNINLSDIELELKSNHRQIMEINLIILSYLLSSDTENRIKQFVAYCEGFSNHTNTKSILQTWAALLLADNDLPHAAYRRLLLMMIGNGGYDAQASYDVIRTRFNDRINTIDDVQQLQELTCACIEELIFVGKDPVVGHIEIASDSLFTLNGRHSWDIMMKTYNRWPKTLDLITKMFKAYYESKAEIINDLDKYIDFISVSKSVRHKNYMGIFALTLTGDDFSPLFKEKLLLEKILTEIQEMSMSIATVKRLVKYNTPNQAIRLNNMKSLLDRASDVCPKWKDLSQNYEQMINLLDAEMDITLKLNIYLNRLDQSALLSKVLDQDILRSTSTDLRNETCTSSVKEVVTAFQKAIGHPSDHLEIFNHKLWTNKVLEKIMLTLLLELRDLNLNEPTSEGTAFSTIMKKDLKSLFARLESTIGLLDTLPAIETLTNVKILSLMQLSFKDDQFRYSARLSMI